MAESKTYFLPQNVRTLFSLKKILAEKKIAARKKNSEKTGLGGRKDVEDACA